MDYRKEFLGFVLTFMKNKFLIFLVMLEHAGAMNDHFEGFVPNDLNITDAAKLKEIGDSLRKFYFDGKDLSKETSAEFIKVE